MSKYIIIFFSGIIFVMGCNKKDHKPQLFVLSSRINLGEIKFDTTHIIPFGIINKGDNVLIIDTVTASCGCTVPSISKKSIDPNDSAILIVKYKPVDIGYFDKKIIIKSNTDSSFNVLSFKGRAIK